jgi:adenylate cyclase
VDTPQRRWRLRLPIAFKLVSLTILVLLGATVPIAFKSAQLFETVSGRREEDANRDQASARALEAEGLVLSYVEKIKICASLMLREYPNAEERRASLDLAFRQDRDLVSIEVLKVEDGGGGAPAPVAEEVNEDLLKPYGLNRDYIAELRETVEFPFAAVFAEQLEIRNTSTSSGAPLMTIGLGNKTPHLFQSFKTR